MAGRRRDGDIQSWAEKANEVCWSQDKKIDGAGGEDLNEPAARNNFHIFAMGRFSWGHFSWDCFSWSPALSLPPGGTGFGNVGKMPLGPYR